MRLKRVIAGGQTGADRAGLECAKALGLETGGTAPKGYRTDAGPDPTLKDLGLVESFSTGYPIRTSQNVKDSDATVWFGDSTSPGYRCTLRATIVHSKTLYENPTNLVDIADKYAIINIAGNRARTNPRVVQQVIDAFAPLACRASAHVGKTSDTHGH